MKLSLSSLFKSDQELRSLMESIPQIILNTPNYNKEKNSRKAARVLPREQWRGLANHPYQLLNAIIGFLAHLNREELAAELRGQMTDEIRKLTCQSINQNYNQFIGEEEFPIPERRRKTLAASIQLLEQIGFSYKHLFRDALKLARKLDPKGVQQVREHGFRILELILVIQRLYALTNKPLPRHHWSELNQIFIVLFLLHDIHTPGEITGFLKYTRKAKEGQGVYSAEQPKSAQQLFVATQLFGLCDAYSWPPEYLHMFEAYTALLRAGPLIGRYQGGELADGQLIIYYDQNRAPSLLLNTKREKTAIVIDLLPLHRLVTTDLNAISQHNDGPVTPALATLHQTDRQPFLQLVKKRLHPQIRMENRTPVTDQCYLRLFHGFRECHYPLSRLSDERYSQYMKKSALSHMLAENSAGIAEDEASMDAGRWYLMDESQSGLRIRTRETQFTSHIFMGQLVAYQKLGDGEEQTLLGHICRIQRLEDNDVDLAITKLSTYAEGVFLRDPAPGKEGQIFIGYLARQDEKRWMLVLHAQFKLAKGTQLLMERNGRHQRIVIGNPVVTQREFIAYHLQTATPSTT